MFLEKQQQAGSAPVQGERRSRPFLWVLVCVLTLLICIKSGVGFPPPLKQRIGISRYTTSNDTLVISFDLTNTTSRPLFFGDLPEARRMSSTGKSLRYSADAPRAGTIGILWPGDKYTGLIRFPEYGEPTKRFEIEAD